MDRVRRAHVEPQEPEGGQVTRAQQAEIFTLGGGDGPAEGSRRQQDRQCLPAIIPCDSLRVPAHVVGAVHRAHPPQNSFANRTPNSRRIERLDHEDVVQPR